MLAVARRRFGDRVPLVEASAEALPFAGGSFDHLTFTYLLRYVDDPGATLVELARVVRPGGVLASLEFGVPARSHAPRGLYVGRCFRSPAGCSDRLGRGRRVPRRLDRSFWSRHPLERQLELWRAAGVRDVRVKRLSLRRRRLWGTRE